MVQAAGHVVEARRRLRRHGKPRLARRKSDIAAIVRADVADRRVAATDYERAGQVDAAARLTAEADVLAAYLADA